jgi:hypothetical protein
MLLMLLSSQCCLFLTGWHVQLQAHCKQATVSECKNMLLHDTPKDMNFFFCCCCRCALCRFTGEQALPPGGREMLLYGTPQT